MNRGRRRSSRRPTTTKVRRNFVTPAQLHRESHGIAPKGRFDPPRIVVNPWNSLVINTVAIYNEAGVNELSISSLATALRVQIGLNTDQRLLMRFRRVDIWTTPQTVVTSQVNLALLPENLTPLSAGSTSQLQWIEDYGTAVRSAHCHYVWPASMSNAVFDSTDSSAFVIYSVDHSASVGVINHVHVLWRPYGGDPVPSFRLSDAFVHLSLSA